MTGLAKALGDGDGARDRLSGARLTLTRAQPDGEVDGVLVRIAGGVSTLGDRLVEVEQIVGQLEGGAKEATITVERRDLVFVGEHGRTI